MYFSSFHGKSRGVAILIHKNLPLIANHFEADSNGGHVSIHGSLYSEKITVLRIYASPDIDISIFIAITYLLLKYSCTFMT